MRKSNDALSTLTQTLQTANKHMQRAVTECGALLDSCHVKRFNNELRGASPVECFNALTVHRLVNKFSVPDPTVANERKLRCYKDWVAFEEKLYEFNFQESISQLASSDLTVLNRARYKLIAYMKNQRFKPEAFQIKLTPGETFISQKGEVSLVHKFENKGNWSIAYAALDAAVDLINRSRGCLLNSLVHHYLDDHREYMPTNTTFEEWVSREAEEATRDYIYGAMCHVCTFTEGARAATVPKNNLDDRFINCEPFWNVILQRGLSISYLAPMLKRMGNNLQTAQRDHKKLIAQQCATIDFSKASDSIHYDCVKFFFPDRVFNHIADIRSYSTYISDLDLIVPNAKISPMGNGFTFEIMTTILLAIARELDSNARVCGDDVIIANHVAPTFVRLANAIGFTVNETKTFINSNFRESCGGFYHDDFGYLETYELTHISTMRELYTTCNKLGRMIRNAPDGAEVEWMIKLRRNLMHLVPAFAKGPSYGVVEGSENHDYKENHGLDCGYVVTENWASAQRSCSVTREIFQQKSQMFSSLLQESYHSKMVGLLVIPVWCPKGRWAATEFVNHAEYAGYLYGMRRPRMTIRGKGKWKMITYLVTDSGILVSSNYLGSLCT